MLTEEQIQRYEQEGFFVIKRFLTPEECEELKTIAHEMINDWEPDADYSWLYGDNETKQRILQQRMIDSGDTISYSIESDAVDPNTGKLNRDKHLVISRIGHALHILNPYFKEFTYSDKIKAIGRDLNLVKPAIRQSMYMFKQPFIGGKIPPHRDSTYVFNDPFKVVGIWIALEDATIENGCLWFIPKSNSESAKRRYIRNPDENEYKQGKLLVFKGEEQYDEKRFVPVEVKAGDCVLIHGEVVHKSEPNKSAKSRQIYALHLFETYNSVYGKENWLQLSTPFPLLYDDSPSCEIPKDRQ
ncbi:unnamed protein product [Adineta ricciae]|uniref:Phytanoyl-CoA dioxygenase n=1 Tax=Adineta ricciae TaxID=249248 RepID=A0A814YQE8_ADIRI|nr:unnamed protein product [Adineta ricciae]CAF1438981.1 unnamed protein product [Adineta ricciae]